MAPIDAYKVIKLDDNDRANYQGFLWEDDDAVAKQLGYKPHIIHLIQLFSMDKQFAGTIVTFSKGAGSEDPQRIWIDSEWNWILRSGVVEIYRYIRETTKQSVFHAHLYYPQGDDLIRTQEYTSNIGSV